MQFQIIARETQLDKWDYDPITAEALFGKRTDRLDKWGSIKKLAARGNEKGYANLEESNHLSSTQCYPFMEAKSVNRWSNCSMGPQKIEPPSKPSATP
jgi:hypothetical protein